MVIGAMDEDKAKATALRDWATEYWEAIHPYTAGGAYVNMYMEEGQERDPALLPRQLRPARSQIKRQYDPDNVFRINQNIRPS